jgi:steroid 5-alpha reductase family enzyme
MFGNLYFFYGLLILVMMTAMYLLAQWKKDNSIVDVFWGLGFCFIAVAGFVFTEESSPRASCMLFMVLVWGLRLAWYIGGRNLGQPEDFRYAQWRKEWGKQAWWRAYLQVFLLQGFFMFIVSLPIIHVMSFSDVGLHWLDFLGIVVWLIGFLTEAIADEQMKRFKARPGTQGQLIEEGLWAISRHPNYLGEILLWWGIFIVALGAPYWHISLISPLVITWLLSSVSGVPMLERKYQGRADFEAYKRRVPALFPNVGRLFEQRK